MCACNNKELKNAALMKKVEIIGHTIRLEHLKKQKLAFRPFGSTERRINFPVLISIALLLRKIIV